MSGQRRSDGSSLADRLNRLFASARDGAGRPPTNREVAEGVSALGPSISESFLHYLRSGQRDNPTKKHLEGIAQYFGVPVAYFFDDEASSDVHEELELAVAMRDADVRALAMRTSRMTPGMRRWLIDMLSGLDAVRGGDDGT